MKPIAAALAAATLILAATYPFSGPTWQAKSAADKSSALWQQITADDTPGTWYSPLILAQLFLESMDTTFDSSQDDFPQQGPFGLDTRKKLIHTVGAIAKGRFIASPGSPYSGLFKGCDNMYLRISTAKEPDASASGPRYAPGIGVKWLRDGVHSANFMVMYALAGQHSYNFFENDLTNHVPNLSADAPLPLKAVKKKFETASKWPVFLGLSDVAKYDQHGVTEASPRFPFRLQFHPVRAVRSVMNPNPDGNDLPSRSAEIPVGLLYEVYAQDMPPAQADNAGPLVKIGEIHTTTHFQPSLFSDRSMFFQHQRFEDDLAYHPEWNSRAADVMDYQAQNEYFYPNIQD